jgi:transcriptional regulator with GAF, ATPase, and Fis domain
MPIDTAALADSIRRLADRNDPTGLTTTLGEVADACVVLFGVTGSGIMIADEQNVTRYVAASDGPGRILEVAESETGQGPCTEAFVNNCTVGVADLSEDPRWHDLAAILAPYGVHAVLGAPIRLGGIPVGTIDVYRDHPHVWDDSEHVALARYAELVGTTVATALSAHQAQELAGQLQYALDYRVLIERGVGYLMARDHIDSVRAFHQLRRAARNTRNKIGEVAAALLETGQLPTDPS